MPELFKTRAMPWGGHNNSSKGLRFQASINLELSVSFHNPLEHYTVHIPPYQRSLTQDRKVLFKG
jgi:hypothetical protein